MIKYKTSNYHPFIERVEVMKETEHFITVEYTSTKGTKFCRREGKRTEYRSFFDTWQEAKSYLVFSAKLEVDAVKENLKHQIGKLENMKGLKNLEEVK